MTFKFKIKPICALLISSALLFSGCFDSSNKADVTPRDSGVSPPPPPPSELVAPGTVLEVNDLVRGLCANSDGNERLIDTVMVRDCNSQHEFEVSGVILREEASDVDFPGRIELRSRAQVDCEEQFLQHTGTAYFDSDKELDTITPSANTWAEGDRTVICLVVSANGV